MRRGHLAGQAELRDALLHVRGVWLSQGTFSAVLHSSG